MKILPINNKDFYSAKNVSVSKKCSPAYYQSPTDSISFKNYNKTLLNAAKKDYASYEIAEKSFGELIKNIKNDKSISKNSFFDTIYAIYEQSGLRDLFSILTLPIPVKQLASLIKNSEGSVSVILAKKDDKPLFILNNLGRKGFMQTSTKQRDIRLDFTNDSKKNLSLEYSTDKKGNFVLSRSCDKDFEETVFYSSTGTPKVISYSYDGGTSHITYFNKDGAKSFFKNWFFGGPQIEPIY